MESTDPKTDLNQQVNQERIRLRFAEFFHRKGVMGAIVNKAFRNLELKRAGAGAAHNQVIHYFLIGHLFKHIDTKAFFAPVLDGSETKQIPSQFQALQAADFNIAEPFFNLLEAIRDINSHYIHTFDRLRLEALEPALWHFIREAFELSSILSLMDEKDITAQDYFADSDREVKLVTFWCEKFFPNEEHQKTVRKEFLQLNKTRAMDRLLTVDVDSPLEWEVTPGSPIFTIAPGRYLSFYASMEVACMSLYKNEANQLISKVKGFKRNDDNPHMSKRRIFTGLSKRFSSQDNDNEHQHLVRFRDVITYLNHYPTPWNSLLEPGGGDPSASHALKEAVVTMEVKRLYPEVYGPDTEIDPERFSVYAKYHLFGDAIKGNYKKAYITAGFSVREVEEFNDILYTSSEARGLRRKLSDLQNAKVKKTREIREAERELAKAQELPNKEVEKLLQRLQSGQFFSSYGRNQDRFMEFALRYLLETEYFGPEAKVCAYQFYTTEEQQDFLAETKASASKQAYDKLKYHQGKLVHFIGYADHLKKYPYWDTPFVVRNNSVQVYLPVSAGADGRSHDITLTIQRALVPYFLEHSLYVANSQSGAGRQLISDYYRDYIGQLSGHLSFLTNHSTITAEKKTELKKYLPKRLLHTYHGGGQPQPRAASLSAVLEDALIQEERYASLLADARKNGTEAVFTKRNKGKQFKLRFIRKAWNELYFKESYAKQVALHGGEHHKSFHITRDEYNDFCRWMFAFDEVPQYKKQLEKLFTAKGFLQVATFRTMFDGGQSLDDWYRKTKHAFKTWLGSVSTKPTPAVKPTLANFETYRNKSHLFINLSSFITFLTGKGVLQRSASRQIQYRCAKNFLFLHELFYATDEKAGVSATFRKRLARHRLEDALLYELAGNYLNVDDRVQQRVQHHVGVIQQKDVELDLKDARGKHLYTLVVPFHKIKAFTELLTHKEGQETNPKNRQTSFLGNLKAYIQHAKDEKEIKSIAKELHNTGKLMYDGLHKINTHLATQSIKFVEVAMALERYYIEKDGIHIRRENRISFDEIPSLKNYVQSRERNKAFHFGVPEQTYHSLITRVEQQFIANEVKPLGVTSWDHLPIVIRNICELFIAELRRQFYDRNITGGVARRDHARARYLKEVVY